MKEAGKDNILSQRGGSESDPDPFHGCELPEEFVAVAFVELWKRLEPGLQHASSAERGIYSKSYNKVRHGVWRAFFTAVNQSKYEMQTSLNRMVKDFSLSPSEVNFALQTYKQFWNATSNKTKEGIAMHLVANLVVSDVSKYGDGEYADAFINCVNSGK